MPASGSDLEVPTYLFALIERLFSRSHGETVAVRTKKWYVGSPETRFKEILGPLSIKEKLSYRRAYGRQMLAEEKA